MRDILLRIPKPSIKPRFCNTTVTINHFKFVDGVIESLVSVSGLVVLYGSPCVLFIAAHFQILIAC